MLLYYDFTELPQNELPCGNVFSDSAAFRTLPLKSCGFTAKLLKSLEEGHGKCAE
jgi:hypothetical protein